MKENARKLLAKVGITRSFPNGKRWNTCDFPGFSGIHHFGKHGKTSAKGRISLVNWGELEVFQLVNAGIQDIH